MQTTTSTLGFCIWLSKFRTILGVCMRLRKGSTPQHGPSPQGRGLLECDIPRDSICLCGRVTIISFTGCPPAHPSALAAWNLLRYVLTVLETVNSSRWKTDRIEDDGGQRKLQFYV